jgi:hypothetical protein
MARERERMVVGLARDELDRVLIGFPDECWPAASRPNNSGYTNLHRKVAALFMDVFDREVHHTCETKTCTNPAHLTVLTTAQHGRTRMKEVCLRGHDMNEESNVRWHRGRRWCRACDAERRRRYRRDARQGS